MRVAIISDIHANIAALEAVLDDLKHQDIERTYCLGDLVGYAPFPNEVIDRIRQDAIPTIIGNYDDGVGFDADTLMAKGESHVGINIMHERAQRIHATLDVQSGNGKGTAIVVQLPQRHRRAA